MAELRIEVDLPAAVHQAWRELPWWYRWLQVIPGERERIEAMTVRWMSRKAPAHE